MTLKVDELQAALVRKLLLDGALHAGPIERAFERVPRHLFLPGVDVDLVYRDAMIPTKVHAGEHVSSSSQPAIMAIMLEQLDAEHGHSVLEVGAGTGFNSALLAEIVGDSGQITAVDLDDDTVQAARANLATAGYSRVRVEQRDGVAGFAERAPFDRIIATVGLGDIPLAWWTQLKVCGRLVMPLEIRGAMKAVAFLKDADGQLVSQSICPAMFMPFRGTSPLETREVRIGPELGLFAWLPPDRDTAASDHLYAVLNLASEDIQTGIPITAAEFRNGLNLWIRAHQPVVVMLHAEGALAVSHAVPAFLSSRWVALGARDRLTLGLFADDEVALLASPPGSPERQEAFELSVRAFGGRLLAERLIECVIAWRRAGSPTDEQLQLRVVPRGVRSRVAATVPLAAGVLEVTWAVPEPIREDRR